MSEHVFLLWHTRILDDEGTEENKLLGVFSTEELAGAYREDAQQLPGFRDFPDGFEISRYTVDRRNWTAGFKLMPQGSEGDD